MIARTKIPALFFIIIQEHIDYYIKISATIVEYIIYLYAIYIDNLSKITYNIYPR